MPCGSISGAATTANCTARAAGWRTPQRGLLSSSKNRTAGRRYQLLHIPSHGRITSIDGGRFKDVIYLAMQTTELTARGALSRHLWTDWVWKDAVCAGRAPAPRPRLLSRRLRSHFYLVPHLREELHLPAASMAPREALRLQKLGRGLHDCLRALFSVVADTPALYLIDGMAASKALTKKKDMLSELAPTRAPREAVALGAGPKV